MKLTKEAIKNSLEGCKQVFDVTLAGLTPEGIELLANVLFGDLNAELERKKPSCDCQSNPHHSQCISNRTSSPDWDRDTGNGFNERGYAAGHGTYHDPMG